MSFIIASDLQKKLKKHDDFILLEDYQVRQDFLITSTDFDCKGIIFKNCEFLNNVFIEDVELNCGIKFKNCIFNKNLSIHEVSITQYDNEFNFDNESFLLEECTIQRKASLSYGKQYITRY